MPDKDFENLNSEDNSGVSEEIDLDVCDSVPLENLKQSPDKKSLENSENEVTKFPFIPKTKLQWVGLSLAILVLGFLYFWSMGGGTTHVKFEVKDDTFTVFLDGKKITTETLKSWDTGGIGYRQHPKRVPFIPQNQALRKILVTNLDTGEILLEELFEGEKLNKETWDYQKGNWILKGEELTSNEGEPSIFSFREWKNISFEAEVGNILGADFYLRVQDSRNYVRYNMRPFRDYDSSFSLYKNNASKKRTKNLIPYLSPIQTFRKTVNLIFNYFPHVILLVVLICGVSSLLFRFSFGEIGIKKEWVFLILAVLLSIGAFCWLRYVTHEYLEDIPHVQDSATQVFQAKILASGKLWAPAPKFPQSFALKGFTHVKNGKMFGQYPPGYPLFLVVGVWVNQLASMPALAGCLLILVIFLIGKEFFPEPWALLASLLLFCSSFFQMSAPNFMNHTVGSLYFALSFLFFVKMEKSNKSLINPIFCGVFLGLLFLTRPMTTVGLCAAFGFFMVFSFLISSTKKRDLLKYLVFLVPFFAFLGFFLLNNYFLMGDPFEHTYGATADKVLKKSLDWKRFSKAGLDDFTLSSLFLMVLLGWGTLETAFFIFGSTLVDKGLKRYVGLIVLSVILVFGAYMFYSISAVTVMYGPRYVFEISFLIILLIVWGGHAISNRVFQFSSWIVSLQKRKRFDAKEEKVLLMCGKIIIQFVFFLFLLLQGISSFGTWKDKGSRPWPGNYYVPQTVYGLNKFNNTSPYIQRLVKQEEIKNALIFVENARRDWWRYGSVFFENNPTFDGDIVYAIDFGEKTNLEVIGEYPDRNYYLTNYDKKIIWEVDENGKKIDSTGKSLKL